MKITWNDELYHYGMPRRSGRYKWGSGKDPYHHGEDGGSRKLTKKEKYVMKAEAAASSGKGRKYIRNFKKAVKAAEKENKANGSKHPHSTGKEFDKTTAQYNKELKDYERTYFNKHPDVSKRVDDGDDYLPDDYSKGYDAIMDKYTDKFRKATLSDIGYKDVQKGMKLYKKYKIGVWGVY